MRLGIFPLELVCFPGENFQLHIFEERYKELMQECIDEQKRFVIVPYIDKKLKSIGTSVIVREVLQTYEDGRMDLKIAVLHKAQVSDVVNPHPGKLYAAARIREISDESVGDAYKYDQIHALLLRFQELLNTTRPIVVGSHFSIFDIASKIGLDLEQKHHILRLETEVERQDFVILYLQQLIPVLQQLQDTKERIAMNGHLPTITDRNSGFQ